MSFFEQPKVDENSRVSEESELAVRQHFNRRSGFITRFESPDYGCDAMLEIVKEPSGASGKKIPAQIKSSAFLSVVSVAGKEFLSLSFSTSRLGYLCSHAPAYGLILVYDDSDKICYFDYVEAVVNRVTEERNSDDWKRQDTVSIHIPKENKLSTENVTTIHQAFSNRFDAHEMLLQQFGDKFDIPCFTEPNIDKSSAPMTAVELLRKYSAVLLEDYDMLRLYQLLLQVSFHELTTSKELIFLAAIVYSEVGKCVEADFYLNKGQQIISEFTEEEVEILKFTRIKVDFLLGRRDKKAFHEDFKSLQKIIQQPANSLQIQINLFYYEVLEKITANDFDDKTEDALFQFFQKIDEANLSERRVHLFKIFHAENVHMFVSSRMLTFVQRLRFSESLGQETPADERAKMLEKTNTNTTRLTKIILTAFHYGKKTNDNFLKAHGYYMLGHIFFTKQFDYLILSYRDETNNPTENFRMFFVQCLESHNLFLSLGLLKEARNALTTAFELNRLAKVWYNTDITESTSGEEGLLKNIRASEKEMGIGNSYTSIVDSAFKNLQETRAKSTVDVFKEMSDSQVELLAKTALEMYDLPIERLFHIVNEIKGSRFFYQHCDIENFTLLCDLRFHQHKSTKYAGPTRFILVSNRTGLESPSSPDVEELARAFGAIK